MSVQNQHQQRWVQIKKGRNSRLKGEQSDGDGQEYDMREGERRSLRAARSSAAHRLRSGWKTNACVRERERDHGSGEAVWTCNMKESSSGCLKAASVGWRSEENVKKVCVNEVSLMVGQTHVWKLHRLRRSVDLEADQLSDWFMLPHHKRSHLGAAPACPREHGKAVRVGCHRPG